MPPFGLPACGKNTDIPRLKSLDHVLRCLEPREVNECDRDHIDYEPFQLRTGLFNSFEHAALKECGVKEGLVLVNAMHITASVFINDDESGLHHDFEVWLEKLAPHEPVKQYRHNVGEDNADAHLKRQVMGREVVVAITEGKLDFGPWEQIFYGEFDGRRRKRVLVKIIGE